VGDAQVKDVWIQDESFFGDLEIFYFVVFFGIQNMILIGGEPFTQVYVV
jgi:hypothetical protein